MKQRLKVLHTLGATEFTGAAAVHLLLLYTGPAPAPTPEFAAAPISGHARNPTPANEPRESSP